ncbi:MAG TPA: 6-hydroxymethylpterin diphosphokinase MptE-like protein [Methanobacterium sp.]
MNLAIWLSWYEDLLEDFGFSRQEDEESARLLDRLLESYGGLKPEDIPMQKEAIVFGAGPSIKSNIKEIKNLNLSEYTLISADGATTALLEEGIVPDIIVTDLDGDMKDIICANHEGAFLAVHAHGNNMEKVKKFIPRLNRVLGTTQSTPLSNVYNFGGFTDGDRALFLAVELGADYIILAGMDFGKVVTKYSRPDMTESEGEADEVKQLKLKYAKKLVEWVAENEEVTLLNISHGEKLNGILDVNFN